MSTTSPVVASLVGRDHAVAALRAEVVRTRESHGGLVLVTGEAGIGKTALVTEALRAPEDDEALVVAGTAWDGEGAPGYWPWTQVLRDLSRQVDPSTWEAAEGTVGGGARALLEGGPPSREVADTVRFRLHDAVTTLLISVSRDRPVVVLLDDLHWADVASVDLLEFLVRHAWFERVLVVATLRDVEVAADHHPLANHVRQLTAKASTIALDGLDESAASALFERVAGEGPPDELGPDLHRRTGGNPYFVQELASLWRGGTLPEKVPPGVAEVIRARLAQVSTPVHTVLTTAAALGREFDRATLSAATGVSDDELAAALEVAVDARLLVRRGGDREAFQHDLVRACLLDELEPAERRRCHAAIVTALERAGDPRGGTLATELAEHAYRALPEVPRQRVLELLLTASEEACGRLAAAEVAVHLERALTLVPDDDLDQRAEVALDLAETQQAAGDLRAARRVYEGEVDRARTRGATRHLLRAVLGLHALGIPDPDEDWVREVELLDEALAVAERDLPAHLGDDPSLAALHVQVLAASGRVRAHRRHRDPDAEARTERAVRSARDLGDDVALAAALLARHDVIWCPGTAEERLLLADEIEEVADRADDVATSLQACLLRMVALLELGDPSALDVHAQLTRRAEEERLPRYRYLARSRAGTLATLRGQAAEACAAIDEALALGERLEEVDRHRLWLEQRWALALQLGDPAEAERFAARYDGFNDSYGDVTRAVGAAAKGWSTETDRLRATYRRLVELMDEYPGLFHASMLHAQARVAIAVGDPELCADVRERLTPLRGLWAVVAGGGTVYGPFDLWRGELAAVEGDRDAAIDALEAAIEQADRLDALPWAVAARLAAARVRDASGAEDDADVARTLRARAREVAHELELEHLAEEAADEATEGTADEATEGADAPPGDAAPDGPPADRFSRDGQVWTLSYAGRTVRMPAAKGLADLHVLLGLPGVEVPAVELLDPQGGEVVRASKRFGGDPVLDESARESYRQRLGELDELIERATRRHDDEQAARLDQERETLLDELRRATGIAGRPRRLGDEAERARKTVTARIRDTLRRLDEQHPELAEHLRASVSTGASCRYQPALEVDWRL